jgi:hypothetical protein
MGRTKPRIGWAGAGLSVVAISSPRRRQPADWGRPEDDALALDRKAAPLNGSFGNDRNPLRRLLPLARRWLQPLAYRRLEPTISCAMSTTRFAMSMYS